MGEFWPFGHYSLHGSGGGPLDIEQVMVQLLEVGLQYKLAVNEVGLEEASLHSCAPA